MIFEEMSSYLRQGKKVRRRGWGNKEYICYKNGEVINELGKLHSFVYSALDAIDWEVYEEKKKTYEIELLPEITKEFEDGSKEYRIRTGYKPLKKIKLVFEEN